MSNEQDWELPEFSFFKNFASLFQTISKQIIEESQRVQEKLMPIIAEALHIQEALQPIFDKLKTYTPAIIEIAQQLSWLSRSLSAIKIMGNAQFVYWDYVPEDLQELLLVTKNTNKALRQYFIQKNNRIIYDTINNSRTNSSLKENIRLYDQSLEAYKNGSYELAVLGFTAVFDGLLSRISNNPTCSLGPRINAILEKLKNEKVLTRSETGIIALVLTIEPTLNSFSMFSDFTKKEPKELNRNWIAHGRSIRKKTKLDCVKMINLIYGLLLIEKLDT